MRQIILDTETTGLEARQGHRIIEIAALEMHNRRLTGNHFHRYLNPDREIEEKAMQVHGITVDFLQDKPRFAEIAAEFLDYIRDAELIIHNAAFDVGFLNAELDMAGRPALAGVASNVVDTLAMAKTLHPGQRNNLDALCKRYGIDNANRTLHGALIDCELLAQVYLAMTRGQESLIMDAAHNNAPDQSRLASSVRPRPVLARALPQEIEAHDSLLQGIERESKGACMWLKAGVS